MWPGPLLEDVSWSLCVCATLQFMSFHSRWMPGLSTHCPSVQPWPVSCVNSRSSPLTLWLYLIICLWGSPPPLSLPLFFSLQKRGFCISLALTFDLSQIRVVGVSNPAADWVASVTSLSAPLLDRTVVPFRNKAKLFRTLQYSKFGLSLQSRKFGKKNLGQLLLGS